MLILTIRKNELIIINNDILIRILDIKGIQVLLGIDAPKDVSIHRSEIWDRIQEGKVQGEP